MAISIDWGDTYEIYVPKSDLTLVQSTPTEIRELDLNWFRLELKDLEDSEDGMPFPDTHSHNTEVELGGLTFARVIEILDPYTVRFEDGQYAVNLTGANSNVADVVNVNQVSVRSQNSAGLISTPLIEYASFDGGVWVNTSSSYNGTTFPTGTKQQPVNNLSDAKLIAEYRGLNKIYPRGSVTVDSGLDYSGFVFEGDTQVHDSVNISDPAGVSETVFRDLYITGTLDGDNELINCLVEDLNYINGFIRNCGLRGNLVLAGNAIAHFTNCYITDNDDPPVLDMGGSGQDAIFPDFSGKMIVHNLSGNNYLGVGLDAGRIIASGTVVSGVLNISGTGRLVDGGGNHIPTGVWNGGVTVINELANAEAISDAVWDEQLSDHTESGSAGDKLNTASSGGVDYDSLADAIWDEDITTHTTADSAGEAQNRLDADISTRSTLTAQQVWEYGTRTLTSFGTLIADIWSYSTRTLSDFGSLVSDIWSNTTRTLTAGTKDSEIDTILSRTNDIETGITSLLGLTGENIKWSNISHNENNLMTSARVTLYDDNTLTSSVKSWDITASYNADGEISSYQMTEV